jgi:hypothetical protein
MLVNPSGRRSTRGHEALAHVNATAQVALDRLLPVDNMTETMVWEAPSSR